MEKCVQKEDQSPYQEVLPGVSMAFTMTLKQGFNEMMNVILYF